MLWWVSPVKQQTQFCPYVWTLGTLPVNSLLLVEEVLMINQQRDIQRKLKVLWRGAFQLL